MRGGPHESGRLGGIATRRTGEIEEVTAGGAYRYLGVDQCMGPKSATTRSRVKKEYLRRVRKTRNSPLCGKSKAVTHNSWCAGVVCYFCCVVSWGKNGPRDLDVATRAVLKQCKAHHKGGAIERLYLPRKEGGKIWSTCGKGRWSPRRYT